MDHTPRTLLPKGTWRTYTTAEGLAGLQTEHLAEDAEGYLWISTWADGVCRFDGDEFRTFTTKDGLPSNRVKAMLLDRQGRLWFGTDGGVCWWDGHTFHQFAEDKGVANGRVSYLFEDREGRLWLGGDVLGFYDGVAFHDLIPEYRRCYGEGLSQGQECDGIAQDQRGELWFGFDHVVRYDGSRIHRYGAEEGLSIGRCVVGQALDGVLWIGISGKIWRCEGQHFQPVPIEFTGEIRKIQQDREGRTWLCTAGGGVLCWDGAQFQRFATQDGLAFNAVNAVHQDREGLFWFATWGGGLSCYDPHGLQIFGEVEGLPHSFKPTLLEDRQGRIWVGSWEFSVTQGVNYLARYDGEGFAFFGGVEGVDLGGCFALCEDREGLLWVGGPQGLARYDGQQFQRLGAAEGFGEFAVSAIAEDPSGHLLLGHWTKTVSGAGSGLEDWNSTLLVSRGDGQGFQTVFRIVQEKGSYWFISVIVPGRNRELYFALRSLSNFGPGGGIGRWREGEEVVFYTTADGLADDNVEDLFQDRQGNLWIATPEGISRFDGEHFQNFTPEHGLPSKQVHCICEDHRGRLWFGTDQGVALYDGQNFQAIQSEQLTAVTDILEDRQGRFWFATRKGVARYTPHQTPPRVRILQVIADQVYQEVQEITAPTSTPQIVFEYKGLSFRTPPKDMRYTCRLLGLQEEWQPATRQQRTVYQELPVGEYVFQVRAIDRDLNYSEPVEVRLKVVPDPRDARIDELEERVRERTRELEEKNRALVVEAALERVRGQALGMQKHGDVLPVAMALFRELGPLGIHLWRSGFWIIDRDTGLTDVYTWGRWGEGQDEQQAIVRQIPLLGFSAAGVEWGKRIFEMWRNQQVFRISDNGETFSEGRNLWVEYMRAHGHYDTHTLWPTEFSPGNGNNIPFSHGILVAMTAEPLTDEQVGVLQKFAGVLSLAYTRFLDLQAAEERARQQDRELAVEHVRNEALTMRYSDDLRKVVARILKEMVKLGVGTPGTNIGFVDEEADRVRSYFALENPRKHRISWTSPDLVEFDEEVAVAVGEGRFSGGGGPDFADFAERWRAGKAWSIAESPKGAEVGERMFVEDLGLNQCPPNWTGDWIITNVPFQYGFVGFRERQHSEEHIAIVQELTSALELGYVRFLDFQRLEEQNRALEEANAQIQEANQHKSQFLSRMSHDLRTPMNAIIGYTRILLRKAKDALDERQYQNLQNIQLSADHLLSLINDILDLSRIEAGRIEIKPAPVDLHKLVQECAAAVASLLKPGVALRQQLEEVPLLRTDPDRLRRALMNLLSNAVKFTEQGSITVSLKEVEGWVELSVADTGVGIAAEDLPHIFEEFRQVERQGEKREGTGLGLAIAKRSVELLGGSISVESTLGRGTTFTLRLKDCEDP